MRRILPGLLVLAVAIALVFAGFLRSGQGFYAVAAALGVAAIAVAAWNRPIGWLFLAVLILMAGLGFPADLGASAAAAALVGALGFGLAAFAEVLDRPRLLAMGLSVGAAAAGWFAVDRWLADSDVLLALGGVLFLVGCVVLAWPALRTAPVAKTVN